MGFISKGSEFSSYTGGAEYWIIICPRDSDDEYLGAIFVDTYPRLEAAKTFAEFLYSNGMEMYEIRKMKIVHSSERYTAHLN